MIVLDCQPLQLQLRIRVYIFELLSQVISNVPAAVMLSGFTQNGTALLLGVNIGGLGTLIASLASLISYQFYRKADGAKSGTYLLVFSAVNFGILIILLLVYLWVSAVLKEILLLELL